MALVKWVLDPKHSDNKKYIMSIKRKLVKIETPAAHTGFLGPDHTARQVVKGEFRDTDPFIILMDDGQIKRIMHL